MADVFISYSRRDKEFVQRLDEALKQQQREAWVDWEGIRPTEEFMRAIYSAIEGADTFIFVLSPDSISSVVCGKEIAHAVAQNKRMIPLVAREVNAAEVPEALARLNWIFCRESDDFALCTATLITALDTDLGWIRAHTRLLTRALEWEAKGHNNSFVLRGDDLSDAEGWLTEAGAEKERQPTALQTAYIIASRKAAARRQRIMLGAVSFGLVVAVGLAIAAWFAREEAVRQQKISRSRELAATALTQLPVDPELSILLAREAAKSAVTRQAEASLRQALLKSYAARVVAGFPENVRHLVFHPDGDSVLAVCEGGTGRIFQTDTGATIAEIKKIDARNEPVFSADGRTFLTVGYDGAARLFDARTGAVADDFHGFDAPVLDAVFAASGIVVLTRGDNGAAVWQHTPRQKLADFRAGKVASGRLSPNGKLAALLLADKSTPLWNVGATTPLASWSAPNYAPVFSPNSRLLMHGDEDDTAVVLDTATGNPVSALRGHTGALKTYSFGPDSRTVVTAGFDQTARVWEAQTGRQLAELRGHTAVILKAAFTPGGNLLVTSASDNTARIWEIETQRTLADLRGHLGEVVTAAFSPDARLVVTGGRDQTVRLWKTPRRNRLRGHTDVVWSAAFSPDGRALVTAGRDLVPRVWDTANARQTAELHGHTQAVWTAVFSPDGKRLLTASADRTARMWDAGTGAPLFEMRGHTGDVQRATFSRDGAAVLTVSGDHSARLWDAANGKLTSELRNHADAAFSPDGRWIATADDDHTARLWETATQKCVQTFRGHPAKVLNVGFDANGDRLITASEDQTARVWETRSGKQIAELHGVGDAPQRVILSPDGKLVLATPSQPNPLIFDAATGERLRELRGHSVEMTSGVFSPDGRFILTAAGDRTAVVWETASGERVMDLLGASQEVSTAVFSPDGTRIATGGVDQAAQIFSAELCVPLDKLLQIASERLTRPLTPGERAAFLDEPSGK